MSRIASMRTEVRLQPGEFSHLTIGCVPVVPAQYCHDADGQDACRSARGCQQQDHAGERNETADHLPSYSNVIRQSEQKANEKSIIGLRAGCGRGIALH
jgi:hypothetical protein